MLSDMDINAIAGTLKLYFRELPEPLLTDRLYPAFMEGIGEVSGILRVAWAKSPRLLKCKVGDAPGIPASGLSSVLFLVAEGPENEVLRWTLVPCPLPWCPLYGSSLQTDLLPRNTGV